MSDWIDIKKDPEHMARERVKAKELRKTQWWQQQLEKGLCHYCGKKIPADKLTMDHVVPVARGGKSTKGNVVPACRECNSDKTYLTPAEIILKELDDQNKSS